MTRTINRTIRSATRKLFGCMIYCGDDSGALLFLRREENFSLRVHKLEYVHKAKRFRFIFSFKLNKISLSLVIIRIYWI